MKLISESITDFRNISRAEFHPSASVNVIYGENGQGKTNLIESIFLLTGAKSFRRVKDASLIRKESEYSVIDSRFEAGGREQTVRLTVSDKGRMASLNHGSTAKASSLAGKLCCVVFSPDHLELIKGSPLQRRNFIDTALCQLSTDYYRNLMTYTRLLKQKNAVLKDVRYVSAAVDMLEAYDQGLAESGSCLVKARRRFIEELNGYAREVYASVSGQREMLSLKYECSVGEGSCDSGQFLQMLLSSRSNDMRTGSGSVGPHRDDMCVFLDGTDARIYGSQGQQRTCVLSLKMAEAEIFRRQLGEDPILLLDDVLSELDVRRQGFLLNRLGGSQAIITCCDPYFIQRQTDASVFRMEAGVLQEV